MEPGKDYVGVTVAYYCHDGKGNYLFNKRGKNCRDEQGKWDCGAGKLEFGDSVEDTLRKEIREEYGAEVLEYEFLGYHDVFRKRDGAPIQWLTLAFRVRLNPAEARNNEPHKFDEIGWFTLDALPSPLHPQVEVELERYRGQM
ncbi:MAG: NUDIX domain-containing protein [Patescibacteria group bacterium]|nr:NUDIX domain-containing protein [Patescibacteria group bacterium]MDE1966192.1 NUDIX domain-containing protein [Patescibacteria group bacterium]